MPGPEDRNDGDSRNSGELPPPPDDDLSPPPRGILPNPTGTAGPDGNPADGEGTLEFTAHPEDTTGAGVSMALGGDQFTDSVDAIGVDVIEEEVGDTPPPLPCPHGDPESSDEWNADVHPDSPAETGFYENGGRSATEAAEAAETAAREDQRVIDATAREAAAEALDYDPTRQIRIRTWLAAITALAAIGTAAFFLGRETRNSGEEALSQMRVLLDEKTGEASSFGEELERAKTAIAEMKKELQAAQKESSDAQEKLLDAEPLKMWIPSIPLKEGKRGRYCPIDTFALNEKFEAEGYSLVEIRQGKKPSYLFLKQTEDGRTHFIRVFIRKTNPRVRWDELQPAQRAAVQAVEWFETVGQEQ